jgi:hypothetical protein
MIDIAFNPQFRSTKLEEYRLVLLQIGIDRAKVGTKDTQGSLAQSFGDVVPLIKLLVHANLILKEKPEQYKITKEKLHDLLGIQFNDLLLLHYNKQLQALLDIIKIAEKHTVEEIAVVQLMSKTDLNKIEKEEMAERPQPAQAAPRAARSVDMRSAIDMAGWEGGEETAPAQPEAVQEEKPKELLAVAVPIKLRIMAPNLNATKFLYEVAHATRTYEIDDLNVWAAKGGNVVMDTTLNVLSFVIGVSRDVETATAAP